MYEHHTLLFNLWKRAETQKVLSLNVWKELGNIRIYVLVVEPDRLLWSFNVCYHIIALNPVGVSPSVLVCCDSSCSKKKKKNAKYIYIYI